MARNVVAWSYPMRRPVRFSPTSGAPAAIARLWGALALGLVASCVPDDAALDTTAVAAAATDNGDDGDPIATDAVCTTGTYRCFASVRTSQALRGNTAYAVPFGLGPAELWSAYNIEPRAVVGKPTVALVLAFGYRALEADLAVYRSQYGLPPCTVDNGCLRIVNQRGQTSPLPPDPPASDNWTVETALDVDMVSAACPLCNILVVQADDNNGEGLFVAQDTAVAMGATVISNSWGAPEEPGTPPSRIEATEAHFNHPGVAIFAAAGDDGYNDGGDGPDYPATSAYVIAVGGTRLLQVTNNARGWIETAWTKGGSACSLAIPKPAYQTTSPCAFKATADVAAVGDPASGVAVYNASVGGWIVAGGTSASSPLIAAIFAGTGNGAQISGAFLGANTDKLNDVTIGNNGACGSMTVLCNAGVGWDGPSGYGTPNAVALLPPGFVIEDEPRDDGDSGGCSTGPGAGAGLLLGAAMLARRRRRR
jgi:MYXO-CTERM domain-containing protein